MEAKHFFSATDNERIAATIQAVEAKTAGEIAVMVQDSSDRYRLGLLLGGLCFGGLIALLVCDLLFQASLWLYPPLTILGTLLTAPIIKRLPPLHRAFIPVSELDQRVEIRAALAFYQKGLHQTRDRSGVLFFFSLFERKVWVIADQGIYQKISQEELQGYTRMIVDGIKNGRAAEALCAEIRRCGELLAHHFPLRAGDTNELANEVIVS